MFLGPILHGGGHILLDVLVEGVFAFVIVGFAGDIFILDLDDILFIVVDDAEEFPLDLEVVIVDFALAEEVHLLLEDEVYLSGGVPERMSMSSMFFFFMVEFQWFLMELSVRPGSILVISAHLLPWAVCARNRIHSSCSIHSTFRMFGFRWLCHRYRHCFPSLPSTNLAINDHRCGPYFYTSLRTRLSSSSVQGFFLRNLDLLLSESGADSLFSSSIIDYSWHFFPISLNY